MTTFISKTVSNRLPALLITVFSFGLVIGIVAGVAAYSYGASKAQEQARIERADSPDRPLGDFCPPVLPPSR